MLAKRLTRHGLAVAGGALGTMLSQSAASAGVPATMVSHTIKAASLLAAGQAVATGVISTQVAALTEGVLKSMLLSKLKVAVVMMLAVGAVGIGAGALPLRTLASGAQESGLTRSDEGNLKETVLALDDRIWEAHRKQDVNTFKNLLADDYLGLDIYRRSYTKLGVLDYVAKWRVTEYSMRNRRVIPLNASSAIVTYVVHFKSTDGKDVLSAAYHNSTAWARRHGNWWAVFSESLLVGEAGSGGKGKMADPGPAVFFWEGAEPLSVHLEKINAEKNP
jgi:hypothetical protein